VELNNNRALATLLNTLSLSLLYSTISSLFLSTLLYYLFSLSLYSTLLSFSLSLYSTNSLSLTLSLRLSLLSLWIRQCCQQLLPNLLSEITAKDGGAVYFLHTLSQSKPQWPSYDLEKKDNPSYIGSFPRHLCSDKSVFKVIKPVLLI
jgi:hypothetical protein